MSSIDSYDSSDSFDSWLPLPLKNVDHAICESVSLMWILKANITYRNGW